MNAPRLLLLLFLAASVPASGLAQTCVDEPVPCAGDGDCDGALGALAAALGSDATTCGAGDACAVVADGQCSTLDLAGLGAAGEDAWTFREFKTNDHAFTCHGCFKDDGASCPIASCKDWEVVPGSVNLVRETGADSAKLTGTVRSNCGQDTYQMRLVALLSVKSDEAEGDSAPSGSPKSRKAGAQDFVYYETVEATATGLGPLAGLAVSFVRKGPSYQQGIGANDKDADLGASVWVQVTGTPVQPSSGPCRFTAGSVIDFNLDLTQVCLVSPGPCDPPILPPCDPVCPVYETDCGCPMPEKVWEMGACATLAWAEPDGTPDCSARKRPCEPTM